MRIDEVIKINIPINIDLDGSGEPKVSVAGKDAEELDDNPVMVPPQQQELELKKAEQGKESPVADKITQSDDLGNEEDDDQDDSVDNIKALAGLVR